MPNPLSADIRARFEVLFAQGLTGREIGRRLMISSASASRLSQRLKRGLRLRERRQPAQYRTWAVGSISRFSHRTDPSRSGHHAQGVAGGLGRCT